MTATSEAQRAVLATAAESLMALSNAANAGGNPDCARRYWGYPLVGHAKEHRSAACWVSGHPDRYFGHRL